MAQHDLTERLPNLLIRQALRLVAKDQIRATAENSDELSGLLVDVWNTFTEQPDTRSWQTLPAEVYSSHRFVTAGEHLVTVADKDYTVNVAAGRTALVWISRQGTDSTIWHKQLGRL
jgi:hypothetical protein